MSQSFWAQQQTEAFFNSRKSPTQAQCDQLALTISGAANVSAVDSPGSLSYTVVCNGCPGRYEDIIISFRETGGILDDRMMELARRIHGDLVPESTCHGNVEGADPPLSVYSMTYLRGSALLEVEPVHVAMSHDEEAKHKRLIRNLAQYFARCWSNPQSADNQAQVAGRDNIYNKLTRLVQELPARILSKTALSSLTDSLDLIFNQDYPQVLTHGDFSITNILIDEGTFEVTGIVDWSLASILPFGADLDILFLTTGFMTLDGWNDYTCKHELLDVFWNEFWRVSGIQGEEHRGRTRELAEVAAKIWAVLRMAFHRNADGSPSDEVLVVESRMEQLRAWLGE